MPREAVPESIAQPSWQSQVAALQAKLPGLQLASRRLVFIGDSITASWDPEVFGQFYGTRAPLLLGISGDYTQGVLERLPQEWGPLQPRLAVLLIGTNNTQWGGSTVPSVALGIAEIVRLIHSRSSGTRVLVLGILPRGSSAADPVRARNAQINALVAQCADGDTTYYLDAGAALLTPAGDLTSEVSFDGLHLTKAGYERLAQAMEPTIKGIMGE